MDIRTQVAIVGAGPVGVTIANLLGVYGLETVVLDRSAEILPYPRAVGMDDEALRVFQACGLAEELLDDMIQNVSLRLFTAKGRQFADIRPQTREFGWWRRNIFMQQLAEKTLRRGLERFPHVQLRLEEDVTALGQDDNGVTLTSIGAGGRMTRIHAEYCVGADGGRSTVRNLLHVPLLGTTHPVKWLVVDVKNAGVEAPYSALHCDPRRPHVCIYLPFNHRRWEFMVFPGEDEETMQQPETVRRLLAPHVAPHVEDPAQLDIVRIRIYTHHSRIAERFVVGRTALAGDAAHLTPPWIGQGLNAGLRDAGNIAWKLAALTRGQMNAGTLASYHAERRDHAVAMTDLADTFGRILMPTHRGKAALRDAFFGTVGNLPLVRDYVLQMRFKPMPRYTEGLVVHGPRIAASSPVGRMFIQPDVEVGLRAKAKLDDVLGPWFSIVGWRCDPQAALDEESRAFWGKLDARFVRVERARSGSPACCVEDVDNQLGDWFGKHGANVAVVRPDRYVAALAQERTLNQATGAFRRIVH